MKQSDNILKAILLIIGIITIIFYALLYNFCEQQKKDISSLKDNQDVESEFNTNKFKYQSDQIERLNKDLEKALRQLKDQKDTLTQENDALTAQKDAFLQEVEKRQQIENESKNIQTSLVDIKAEADALKQDMQGWQKDYVSVLAQIEKKTDDNQYEIKTFEDRLIALNIPGLRDNIISLNAAITKLNSSANNSSSSALPAPVPDPKIETVHSQSQQ